MFNVKANPTFPATITIVGQGREQELKVIFRHVSVDDWNGAIEKVGSVDNAARDLVLQVIESWEADVNLDETGVDLLLNEQPGVHWAIFNGYRDAMQVSRKGN